MDTIARKLINHRSGGQALVETLIEQGCDTIFCVPGESFLGTLDALHDATDKIRVVVCRHEGGASYMAEAYGRLTGRPGVCFVTRGPGAANAVIGVHTAHHDGTPMVLFIGQVEREAVGRRAFQEMPFAEVFAGISKWSASIDEADRVPELGTRAFQVAASGRPGPVVLTLPEDMQTEPTSAACGTRIRSATPMISLSQMDELATRLREAKRPMLILGGSGWTAQACDDIKRFASVHSLPVAVTFRCNDLFDNADPHFAGVVALGMNKALAQRIEESDLLIILGAHLGEVETAGYSLMSIPRPRQTIVHVLPGADEIGNVFQADLPIVSAMPAVARCLSELPPARTDADPDDLAKLHADLLSHSSPKRADPGVDYASILTWLRDHMPEDAIFSFGAGNYCQYALRYLRFSHFPALLAPRNAPMGYSVPAAVAASIVHPDRPIIAFAGDGCFLMNGQELATAVALGSNVLFVIVNNGIYGAIRMHQEKTFPGRVIASDLVNPDFVSYAAAFGVPAKAVTRTEDFETVFHELIALPGPKLIELRTDPEALSPNATISQLRRAATWPA